MYNARGEEVNALTASAETPIFDKNGARIPREAVASTLKEAKKREINRVSQKNVRMKAKRAKEFNGQQRAMIASCLMRSNKFTRSKLLTIMSALRQEIRTHTTDGSESEKGFLAVVARCDELVTNIPKDALIEQLCTKMVLLSPPN